MIRVSMDEIIMGMRIARKRGQGNKRDTVRRQKIVS
jgi:hypothetical protein